jgi:hypothetical protein
MNPLADSDATREMAGYLIVLLLGIAVLAILVFVIQRIGSPKPPPAGICRHCGYSLTGNVSGVCPECGTRVGKVG